MLDIKLYHFTSLDNWESIKNNGLKPYTVIDGDRKVLMLTKQADRHCQLWAMGEHKGKTDVRLSISTCIYKELIVPEDEEELHKLVRLGAMDIDAYGITGKSINVWSDTNWFTASSFAEISDVKIWNPKSRRYAPKKMTPEEEYEYLQGKLSRYYMKSNPWLDEDYYTDWYEKRWINHYEKRMEELKKIILSNEINGLQA